MTYPPFTSSSAGSKSGAYREARHCISRYPRLNAGVLEMKAGACRTSSNIAVGITCWNGEVVRVSLVVDTQDREITAWRAIVGRVIRQSTRRLYRERYIVYPSFLSSPTKLSFEISLRKVSKVCEDPFSKYKFEIWEISFSKLNLILAARANFNRIHSIKSLHSEIVLNG